MGQVELEIKTPHRPVILLLTKFPIPTPKKHPERKIEGIQKQIEASEQTDNTPTYNQGKIINMTKREKYESETKTQIAKFRTELPLFELPEQSPTQGCAKPLKTI